MTLARKYSISTLAFYILALPFIPFFKRYSRSGPCTPGLDVFFPLLVLLSALFGFVISFAARLRGKKAYKGPALINGAVLLILIIVTYLNCI